MIHAITLRGLYHNTIIYFTSKCKLINSTSTLQSGILDILFRSDQHSASAGTMYSLFNVNVLTVLHSYE